jgi:transcriptional regulator with XRE-family HTH domain
MHAAGSKMVDWRKRNDLSQRQAAKKAGLTHAVWQAVESGSSPRADAIARIVDVTGGEVSLDDFREPDADKAVRRAIAESKRVRHGGGRASKRTGTDG